MREVPPLEAVEPDPDDLASAAAPTGDLGAAWERVCADVMKAKPLAGSVLRSVTPLGVEDGVLRISIAGNHFHRERLADPANRSVINQAIQQHVAGARGYEIDAGNGDNGGARTHPAVQAALNMFPGDVVAVRPRATEEGASS